MKHTLLYIGVALTALAGFASCSSDDELTGSNPVAADNAVIIKASVGKGSAFTRTNPASDDVNEQTKFNPGDEIIVINGPKEVVYALGGDGTTWNSKNPGEYLTWNSTPTTYVARYPSTGWDGSWGIMPADQSTPEKMAKADFMDKIAVVSEKPEDHTLRLELERQTFRVIVKIVGFNDQYDPSTAQIENLRINSAMYTNYMNLTGNFYSDQPDIIPYEATDGSYIALVAKSAIDVSEDIPFISFDVRPTPNSDEVDHLVITRTIDMDPGKSYTYNVTVGKNKATIESVTVEDWTSRDVIPGGEAMTE